MIQEHIERTMLASRCAVDSLNAFHQTLQTLIRVADNSHSEFARRITRADAIASSLEPYLRDPSLPPGFRQVLINASDFLRNLKNL